MIKEKAIPTGISAFRKPTKIGMEEQEQKGVTAPKSAAEAFPAPNLCLEKVSFSLWGGRKVRIKAIVVMMARTRRYILIVSYTKKLTLLPILEAGSKLNNE